MVRPGIEVRGKVANQADIQRAVIQEMGLARRLLAKAGVLNKVPLINRFPPVQYADVLRAFLRALPDNIEASGVKQKFVVDHTIQFDPDFSSQYVPYDPAVDLGASAVAKLLKEASIDPKEVGSLYVACTTFNSADPPLADRILSKLVRDKFVQLKDVMWNGESVDIGWVTHNIVEGCVGWIKLVEMIEHDMQLNELNGKQNKYAIGVAIAANSIHMQGNNPHEIIAYGDGAAAALFAPSPDNSGPFIIGVPKKLVSEADRVIHPFREPSQLSLRQKIGNYFNSNYVPSRKIAHIISEEVPEYLTYLLESNDCKVSDLEQIIISQTSKGVLDKTIIRVSERYLQKEKIQLNPNEIRPDLKDLIDTYCEGVGEIANSSSKKKSILCNYFLKVISEGKDEKVCTFMRAEERKLFDFMRVLYDSICRVYDRHGYTGVASIPMAIAQGVEDRKIKLAGDNMVQLGSGLGVNLQGLLMINKNKTKRNEPDSYKITEPLDNGNGKPKLLPPAEARPLAVEDGVQSKTPTNVYCPPVLTV